MMLQEATTDTGKKLGENIDVATSIKELKSLGDLGKN